MSGISLLDDRFYCFASLLLCPCVPSKAPLSQVLLASLGVRKTSVRSAWISSWASFLQGAFGHKFHSLTSGTPPPGCLGHPGSHTTAEAKAALLSAPQAAQGASKKRKRDLESIGTGIWLARRFFLWRRLYHHSRPGSIHLSLDGARSGGKESNLGVILHTGCKMACWLPPVDC